MTDRQLMQQALDALEKLNNINSYWWQEVDEATLAQMGAAISALNERLAHCDRCGKKLGGEGDIHTCSPRLDQGPDYERGFVDGMQKQMQSSVDRAVNRMAREAGFQSAEYWPDDFKGLMGCVERLVELARADEREACADIALQSPPADEYECPLVAVYKAIKARGNT